MYSGCYMLLRDFQVFCGFSYLIVSFEVQQFLILIISSSSKSLSNFSF